MRGCINASELWIEGTRYGGGLWGPGPLAAFSMHCTLNHCLLLQGYLSTEVSTKLRMLTMLTLPSLQLPAIACDSGCYYGNCTSVPDSGRCLQEFASIPELSINPLHQRLGQIFSEVNFKVRTKRALRPELLTCIRPYEEEAGSKSCRHLATAGWATHFVRA